MSRAISFEEAKRRYVNRYTMEHVPTWSRTRPADHGGTETRYYAPQFRTDREWYENTRFYGESGHIGRKGECFTTGQTFPLGHWLDRPFTRS